MSDDSERLSPVVVVVEIECVNGFVFSYRCKQADAADKLEELLSVADIPYSEVLRSRQYTLH